MSLFLVEEQIEIAKSTEEVWKHISTFTEQKKWSAWLIKDPKVDIQYSSNDGEIGAKDSWKSDVIGSGSREIINIIENELIDYTIILESPMKISARSYMALQKCGQNCTNVIWGLEGNLPWYKGFLKNTITKQLSDDYKLGLEMLKYYCETGNLPSTIEVLGVSKHEETFTLGIERVSSKGNISSGMQKDFSTLWSFVKSHETGSHGARAYYTGVNMKKDMYSYRSSILLSKDEFLEIDEQTLPDNIKKYYYISSETFTIRHTGSYNFIPFVWNTAFAHLQKKKLKANFALPSFEDYINDPKTTPEHKYITDINIYLK